MYLLKSKTNFSNSRIHELSSDLQQE